MRAFINPGDGVLVPKPYWVSYTQQVLLSDGIPIEVDFKSDLKLDTDHLKKVISEFKAPIKLIIINSPNNPTGTVYAKEELEEIAQICLENGIYIIADEVYEKFIYGNISHHSIAGFSQELKDLTITVNAVSKTYAMTGWRIGYCAADKAIIKQMSKIQGQSPSNPCSIAQWAAIEAMEGDQGSVELMRNEYEKRRNYVYDRLKAIDGIECGLPEGAFYAFPKVSNLYNGRVKSSDDFSGQLLSYAASMDKIIDGMDRIEKFCKGL